MKHLQIIIILVAALLPTAGEANLPRPQPASQINEVHADVMCTIKRYESLRRNALRVLDKFGWSDPELTAAPLALFPMLLDELGHDDMAETVQNQMDLIRLECTATR